MKAHPTQLGYGILIWKRTLRQLLRLSYHKDNPKIITFHLKGKANTLSLHVNDDKEVFQETFLMENSTECIKLLKENITKLKSKK